MQLQYDQLRAINEVDPLNATQDVAEELNINHSTVVRHLRQIGKVEKLDKWVSHEFTEGHTSQNERFKS